MVNLMRNTVEVKFTSNFYDENDQTGVRDPKQWDTEVLQADWWWVMEYEDVPVRQKEGIIVSFDAGDSGLVEVTLTKADLEAMLERVKARTNQSY